ncbi:MAG: serine--tRNA ligase [Patescibacteria group bacterium]
MLDIKYIRENAEKVKQNVLNRRVDPKKADVDELLLIDTRKTKLQREIEDMRALRNKFSESLKNEKDRTPEKIAEGKKIKESIELAEKEFSAVETRWQELMYAMPNISADDVPTGKDDTENLPIKKWGEPKKFDFQVRDHVDLGESLGIIDIETAGKVTGSRFNYLKGDAVLLQNALYQFAISVLTNEKILKEIADEVENGYNPKTFIPVAPPLLINPETYTRIGRLSPETEIERYALPRDNQYLIGSAEHTLAPMHMDQTLRENDLPLRYFAFTPAFRREAGSYGKDVRGILRQHQFDKVEMESFTTPENGLKEQKFIVGIQEYIMQALKLPYQVVLICTGDIGTPDYRQIDIETWVPAQNKYRETHSSDYVSDYQARRLQTRVKLNDGKTVIVHMNDATVLAMGRILITILENYQNPDGSVTVPEVLREYVGKDKISPSLAQSKGKE